MARAINLPMVLNTLSSRAFVLCLRIRMCTGPLRILSCLFKVSIKSMKNSRRGPPPSTAGSPKNVTRRCFLSPLRASCQMCVRRTVMRWVFCVYHCEDFLRGAAAAILLCLSHMHHWTHWTYAGKLMLLTSRLQPPQH